MRGRAAPPHPEIYRVPPPPREWCLLFNLFKIAANKSSRKRDVTGQQPGGAGRWNGGGTKKSSKIASNPKPNPQIPQWPLARGGFPFLWRQPMEGLSPLPWHQPTEKGIILTMNWSHVFMFTKCRHHFTWYHFLRKFPIVFHSIIIQNYDV